MIEIMSLNHFFDKPKRSVMKSKNLFQIAIFAFVCLALATSCVKEGPMGLAGKDGEDGLDGKDGVDGNVTCIVCHTTAFKEAVISQYNVSQHAAGAATARSTSNQCAPCHSHEGFLEVTVTGKDTTWAGVAHPSNINCETCHSSHKSFDFKKDGPDYALRTTKAVDLMLYTDPTKVLDFGNNSNLCANCHQPRNSYRVPGESGETTYSITSSRFGPHHGTQATLLEGIGGYNVAGAVSYPGTKSHPHRTAGCISCHMGDYKDGAGGHTWKPSLANCKSCHSSAGSFDLNGVQTEVEKLVADLKTALISKGVLDASGNLTKPGGKTISATNPLVLPVQQAGAYWNYMTIVEDRSEGVHNPAYIKALLKNSIQALQ